MINKFLRKFLDFVGSALGVEIKIRRINKSKSLASKSGRRSSERRNTLMEVMLHLKDTGFYPGTIIDIGVAYGTPGLYGIFKDAKYMLIEPLAEWEAVCEDICDKYNAEYIIAAAGKESGVITINVHPDLSGSSTYNETEGEHVDGSSREVNVVTVDELFVERNLKAPVIIKIDVQGAELDVLEGAKDVLGVSEIIILEVSLFQFFREGPQFYDIVHYMKQYGFVVYDIFGGDNRLLDNALGQIDLVFVKENGLFRKSHDYASRVQRETFKTDRVKKLNPD